MPITVAVVGGSGGVGITLAGKLAAKGHSVFICSRNPGDEKTAVAVSKAAAIAAGAGSVSASSTIDGVKAASVVLLTFPSELAATADSIRTLAASLGDVTGKIVVDVTNPLVKGALGELHYAGQSSGGEEFAKALPTAHVFKAFNTIGQRHMADPSGPVITSTTGAADASVPLDMLYAGAADAPARAVMAEVIASVGFHPVYIGPIRYSRNLESIAELWIHSSYFKTGAEVSPEGNWGFGVVNK